MPSTTVLSKEQLRVWSGYQRMRVQLSGRLNRELARETGLSEADYDILLALTDSPDDSVRSLALRCGLEWEKSRLSHQLRRMEERGLISRHECAEDNRSSVVTLTDAGREAIATAADQYQAAVRRYVTDVLSPEQLIALETISAAVLDRLGEDGSASH